MPQPRPLYDTWKEPNPANASHPWRVQLVGYVGQFDSEESAKRYIAGVEAYRAKFGTSSTSTQASRTNTSGIRTNKAPST
jgi:hypothetical protein